MYCTGMPMHFLSDGLAISFYRETAVRNFSTFSLFGTICIQILWYNSKSMGRRLVTMNLGNFSVLQFMRHQMDKLSEGLSEERKTDMNSISQNTCDCGNQRGGTAS